MPVRNVGVLQLSTVPEQFLCTDELKLQLFYNNLWYVGDAV